MAYIHSEGPYPEFNFLQGTETPIWYLSKCTDDGEMIVDYGKYYSLADCIAQADVLAAKAGIAHVCEAGRA